MRIGVNGTGRIGRLTIRRMLSSEPSIIELAAVNTTSPIAMLAHLLKYDSVHGKWGADIGVEGDRLIIDGRSIPVFSHRDPAQLPWREHGVELAIDATGQFKDRLSLGKHLDAGADRVLLTAPGRDVDATIVLGANERRYDPSRHRLISAASCTTNCLAPVLRVLNDSFGVERGWMTSIHAYTNDQNHLDNPHEDWRRARACASSLIPTTTGVSKALAAVLPELAPVVQGLSVRVPTPDVSLLDLQVILKRTASAADIRSAFRSAAAGPLGEYVGYNELPLVSADYIGSEKSAIVDGLSVMADGVHAKLLAWYDNEWGYACRVVDCATLVASHNKRHRTANNFKVDNAIQTAYNSQ